MSGFSFFDLNPADDPVLAAISQPHKQQQQQQQQQLATSKQAKAKRDGNEVDDDDTESLGGISSTSASSSSSFLTPGQLANNFVGASRRQNYFASVFEQQQHRAASAASNDQIIISDDTEFMERFEEDATPSRGRKTASRKKKATDNNNNDDDDSVKRAPVKTLKREMNYVRLNMKKNSMGRLKTRAKSSRNSRVSGRRGEYSNIDPSEYADAGDAEDEDGEDTASAAPKATPITATIKKRAASKKKQKQQSTSESAFGDADVDFDTMSKIMDAVEGEHSSGSSNANNNNNNNNRDITVEEVFTTDENGERTVCVERLRQVLEQYFGHKQFRGSQERAIVRTLLGQSSLVILPTGMGKSLCYQLPAFLLPKKHIALVITPLISLMVDQLLYQLPKFIPGAMLSSNQSKAQITKVYEKLYSGAVQVLFISPERLNSERFIEAMQGEGAPKIAFACVDEAHCISEWSHNFRPSYLHLKEVLKDRLGVECILALTGTATRNTQSSICKALDIPITDEAIIRMQLSRQNLTMTVSRDIDRMASLTKLLKSARFSSCDSIIVYTMLQKDADEVANHLSIHNFNAVSYHAGLPAGERKRRQDNFLCGKVPIIVATVAFGMGINKPDIRAVIHYNMPRSIENYVQEIGRAGRDGKPAQCHLFFHNDDYIKLRSLSYADGVDDVTLKKLLHQVFAIGNVANKARAPFEVALAIEKTEVMLDAKREVIATVLSLLELHADNFIRVLPSAYATCIINFMKTEPEALAKRLPFVAAVLKFSKRRQANFEVDVTQVAMHMNMSLDDVYSHIQKLKDQDEIIFEMDDNAFCFRVKNVPSDIPKLMQYLSRKLLDLENVKLNKLNAVYRIMRDHSSESAFGNSDSDNNASKEGLEKAINEYFDSERIAETEALPPPTEQNTLEKLTDLQRNHLRGDIMSLLRQNHAAMTSGRCIARILHGITSPGFDARDWYANPLWGRYSWAPFHGIRKLATEMLVQFRALERSKDSNTEN